MVTIRNDFKGFTVTSLFHDNLTLFLIALKSSFKKIKVCASIREQIPSIDKSKTAFLVSLFYTGQLFKKKQCTRPERYLQL